VEGRKIFGKIFQIVEIERIELFRTKIHTFAFLKSGLTKSISKNWFDND